MKFIAHWRGTRAWETPWQQLQRCGWAWRLGTGGAWSWYRASPLCTLWGPPHTAWHSGEWAQSQGTEPAPSADGKVNYCIASQASKLSWNAVREMTLRVQARFCYLSGLLQVIMVGGDGCEDRNHRQLYVSAGKSLRGLLQALRYQPVCHLWAHIKSWQADLEILPSYVRTLLWTLPCSRVWSKDGPSCKGKWAAALYTEASRAVFQEPIWAPSSLFPAGEKQTVWRLLCLKQSVSFYGALTYRKIQKKMQLNANLVLCSTIFSVMMCIPFWGTAVGHWRRARRADRLNVLSLKREQVGEQGCQQGEMLSPWVSFHSLASLAPWNQQLPVRGVTRSSYIRQETHL